VKVQYRRARLYYDHDLFDQAIPLFAQIVDEHAGEELAVYAANLLLDSLNVTRRQPEIARWVARFQANPALMKDPEFARQMRSLGGDVLELEGRQAEKRGAFAACGQSMKRAADAEPEHPHHAERLYNAALCYRSAGAARAARAARAELLATHPESPLAARLRAATWR
jgi:tetratricopeptide (TPR) repeat protein